MRSASDVESQAEDAEELLLPLLLAEVESQARAGLRGLAPNLLPPTLPHEKRHRHSADQLSAATLLAACRELRAEYACFGFALPAPCLAFFNFSSRAAGITPPALAPRPAPTPWTAYPTA